MEQAADFDVIDEGDRGLVVRFTGVLDIETLGDVPDRLDQLPDDYGGRITTIDMQEVQRLDTVGAWIVYRASRDNDAEIINMGDENCRLVEAISKADEPGELVPEAPSPLVRILGQMGEAVIIAMNNMLGMLGFFGALVVTAGRLIRHPGRIRFRAVVRQMELVGVTALAIVGLMSFLIGIVIAQQGAVQLRQFGAEVFTVNLVGRITLRELGVLMTAIMVAGRSGSAFAAQIGTMQLTEEVDAMRTIGVSPMEALVMPRVASSVLMMPLLGFYSSLVALIGGGLLCWIVLDIPPTTYVARIREVVPMHDLWVGLIKAPVFGAIIGVAGCYHGMQVRGNAEQVGIRTTAAVVQAIFIVIVLDAFFAIFFTALGWGVSAMKRHEDFGKTLAESGPSENCAIRIRGLRNAFGDQLIHDNLCLDVKQGEILGVVGGSGTGKSVLMRSIIGLQHPEDGEIEVLGRSILDQSETDSTVRSNWGVLFQGGALFSTLTVAENVMVPLNEFFPDMSQKLREEIALYKIILSGLPAEAACKYPSELSGGMKKRAGLARALALDPQLLFLDEPTAGLDPIGAAAFDLLTRELQKTIGYTVFLITHDLDTLHEICDRVAVLSDKHVVAIGTIEELLELDHPWIQEYFNGPRGRAAASSRHAFAMREQGK